jgi:hypothetical protein
MSYPTNYKNKQMKNKRIIKIFKRKFRRAISNEYIDWTLE